MNDANTQLILDTLKQYQAKNEKHFEQIDRHLKQSDAHFVEIDRHLKQHDNNFEEIKNQLNSLGNTVARIEYFIGDKAQIALEHASIAIEHHEEMKETLNAINSKLDKHDLHIEVLEEKIY